MLPTHRMRFVFGLFIAAALACFAAGCAGERAELDSREIEEQAAALQEALFVERDGRWLGLDENGEAWRLVELDKPAMQIVNRKVSGAERAAGVTERHTVSFHCSQFRVWDERWSEWRRAPGGGPSKKMLTALSPTGAGVRSYTLEKKDGRWSVRGVASRLESDADALARLIAAAYAAE